MKKWIAGLLVSILAGLAVWLFTQSPYSPFLGPKVELTSPDMPDRLVAGKEFLISFRASNQGKRLERECRGFVAVWPMKAAQSTSTNRDGAGQNKQERVVPVPEAGTTGGGMVQGTVSRAAANCKTQTPEFHLGGLSGSSTEVLVKCVVHQAGTFRMIHGITCRKNDDSKWQLDHQSFIEVKKG